MTPIPSKVKKVIQATTNRYLSIMAHAYTQTHHFNLGPVVAGLESITRQCHLFFFLLYFGKYKGSFSSLLVWLYVFYLSFTHQPFMFVQKNFTSDSYKEHVPSIALGTSKTPHWIPLRTEEMMNALLNNNLRRHIPFGCRKNFDCFFFLSLRTSRGDALIMITQVFC